MASKKEGEGSSKRDDAFKDDSVAISEREFERKTVKRKAEIREKKKEEKAQDNGKLSPIASSKRADKK